MDYMRQEQERGITIQSAVINFDWHNSRQTQLQNTWKSAKINLIDTPGHADFTLEVERAMRVLDGAVVLLDGVEGVEAQTRTVWGQADKYNTARLVFVNKLDRQSADFSKCLIDLSSRYGRGDNNSVTILPLQLPLFRQANGPFEVSSLNDGILIGSVDLVGLKILESLGTVLKTSTLDKVALSEHAMEAVTKAREFLMETLSDKDDIFLERILDDSPMTDVEIMAAVRRCTVSGDVVPVLCGSALKTVGIKPLMDAIVDYLPSPMEQKNPQAIFYDRYGVSIKSPQLPTVVSPNPRGPFCALAFKVIHDKRRGPLVIVRVYSGTLNLRSQICNTVTRETERIVQILQVFADDYVPTESISVGDIAILAGLKHTKTGDTLTDLHASYPGAKKSERTYLKLPDLHIPPPVFMCSVEPHSAKDDLHLESSLEKLHLEDPSFSISTDAETGQRIVRGMGELHLEIIIDRLLNEFKVKCKPGPVWISYRESLKDNHGKVLVKEHRESRLVNGVMETVSLKLQIEPATTEGTDNIVEVDQEELTAETVDSLRRGILASLMRGPLLHSPVQGVKVSVTDVHIRGDSEVSSRTLYSAGSAAIRNLFKDDCMSADVEPGKLQSASELVSTSSFTLQEPVMRVSVQTPSKYMGNIVGDFTATRRGDVERIGDDGDTIDVITDTNSRQHDRLVALARQISHSDTDHSSVDRPERMQTLEGRAPVAGLIGYSASVRSLTQGFGRLQMTVDGFQVMKHGPVVQAIIKSRGY